MTSPIAPIAGISQLVPPTIPPAGSNLLGGASGIAGMTGGGASGAAGVAGSSGGGFDAALATAMGGNPLASLVGAGMVNPTSAAAQLAGLAGATQGGSTTATGAVIPAATRNAPTLNLGGTNPDGLNLASSLANGFDAVQAAQHEADTLAVQAATGQLIDPAQLTVATTKAQLMTQVAAAVQSKAVTAFNTIMSMQA